MSGATGFETGIVNKGRTGIGRTTLLDRFWDTTFELRVFVTSRIMEGGGLLLFADVLSVVGG